MLVRRIGAWILRILIDVLDPPEWDGGPACLCRLQMEFLKLRAHWMGRLLVDVSIFCDFNGAF